MHSQVLSLALPDPVCSPDPPLVPVYSQVLSLTHSVLSLAPPLVPVYSQVLPLDLPDPQCALLSVLYSQVLSLAAHDAGKGGTQHQRHQQRDADGGEEVGRVAACRHLQSRRQRQHVLYGRPVGRRQQHRRCRVRRRRQRQLAALKLTAEGGGGPSQRQYRRREMGCSSGP